MRSEIKKRIETELATKVRCGSVVVTEGCIKYDASYCIETELISVSIVPRLGEGGGCHEWGGKDTGKRDPRPDSIDNWGSETPHTPDAPWHSVIVTEAKKQYALERECIAKKDAIEAVARLQRLRDCLVVIPNIKAKDMFSFVVGRLGELFSDEGMSGYPSSEGRQELATLLHITKSDVENILDNMSEWEIPANILKEN